jgi:hypothetical protein
MGTFLYDRALASSGKRYFLDKTPRYYLILSDLHEIFPQARCVLLLRNPLAVLVSILRFFVQEHWSRFARYRIDLMEAPRLLDEARGLPRDWVMEVRYEELVQDPEEQIRRLSRNLELEYVPTMVDHGCAPGQWPFGDPRAFSLGRPVPDYADAWVAALRDAQVWRLAHEYLERLGPELFMRLGYDYDALVQVVARHQPRRLRLGATFGLDWLWKAGNESDRWRSGVIRLRNAAHRHGVLGAGARGLRVLVTAARGRVEPGSSSAGVRNGAPERDRPPRLSD